MAIKRNLASQAHPIILARMMDDALFPSNAAAAAACMGPYGVELLLWKLNLFHQLLYEDLLVWAIRGESVSEFSSQAR